MQDLTGTNVGRFAVRARLGVGGMGEVYRAEDTKLKRPVALKRVSPALGTDAAYRQRFLKEAERASALTHQHIAAIYDVLEENGEIFLVMEYVEGHTLRERMKEALSQNEFIEIAIQCGEALAAAHGKGLVHRDIKPENIMLTTAGQVKILDFGVARRLPRRESSGTTETSDSAGSGLSGTPAYMAPEVLLERDADGRADIFSLGVVFYEMLAGQHPFRAESFMATCDRILREAPTPVQQLNPQLAPEVELLLARMLAKEPAQRYASAEEMLGDLRAFQRGTGVAYPGLRAAWQRPAVRLAAGAVAMIAAFSLALLLWPPSRPAFAERGWVLVGSLENRTGQSVFDHTLQEALTITLEQSRHLNVFPRSQLTEVLRRMKRDAAQEIDQELGREICLRENLQAVVLGSIGQLGDDYVILLRATDPQGRVLFSAQKTAAGRKEVLPALDHLAAELREELGESLESIQKSATPLERVTSRSLEAIQFFSQAKRQHYAGNHGEAQKLLQRAIELDPEFAVAYEGLAMTYFSLSQPEEGRRNLQRAVELAQHLTEPERNKIMGDYHLLVTRDMNQAIESFRVLLALYPDNTGGRNNLALAYQEVGQFDNAVREAETVLRQWNTPVLRSNLAYIQFLAGRPERAIQLQEENILNFPEYKRSLFDLGVFYASRGEGDRAKSYFQKLAAMGGVVGTDAFLGLADLYASSGRYEQASEELRKAVRMKQEAGDVVGEANTRLMLASLSLDQNGAQAARREAGKAAKLTREPELLALAGAVLARAGDRPGARSVLKRLEASGEKVWAALVRSELELATGKAAAAAATLQEEGGTKMRTLLLETKARAYGAAGRRREEVAAYEQILARQGERTAAAPDAPAFHRVVQIYYRLGVAYDELQDWESARKNLERFLEYYRDANPRAPFMGDARRRLTRLISAKTRY